MADVAHRLIDHPRRLVAGLIGAAALTGCALPLGPPTPSTAGAAAPPRTQPTPPPVTAPGEAWAVVVPGGGDDTARLQATVDRYDRVIIWAPLRVDGTVRITRPVEIRWRAR